MIKTVFKVVAAGVVGAFVLFGLLIWAAVENESTKRVESRPATEEPITAPAVTYSYAPAQPSVESMSPSQWLKELLAIEKFASDVRALSEVQQISLALSASKAIGGVDAMQPAPRGQYAQLYCTLAAQALRNYIDDMRQDHVFSADDVRIGREQARAGLAYQTSQPSGFGLLLGQARDLWENVAGWRDGRPRSACLPAAEALHKALSALDAGEDGGFSSLRASEPYGDKCREAAQAALRSR